MVDFEQQINVGFILNERGQIIDKIDALLEGEGLTLGQRQRESAINVEKRKLERIDTNLKMLGLPTFVLMDNEADGAYGVEVMNEGVLPSYLNNLQNSSSVSDIHVKSYLGRKEYGVLLSPKQNSSKGYFIVETSSSKEERPFLLYCTND